MQLRVLTWLNNCLEIEVQPQHTVLQIKTEIERSLGTFVKDQVLLHGTYPLPNDWALSELLNMEAGSIQTLRLNLSKTAMRNVIEICRGSDLAKRFKKAPAGAKLLMFDFDDTLATQGEVSQEMKSMLLKLKGLGHFLAVASFNRSVLELLRLAGIDDLFDVIVGGFSQTITKADIVLSVLRCYQFDSSCKHQGMFFDDKEVNIVDVEHAMGTLGWGNLQSVHVASPEVLMTVLSERFPAQFKIQRPASVAELEGGQSPRSEASTDTVDLEPEEILRRSAEKMTIEEQQRRETVDKRPWNIDQEEVLTPGRMSSNNTPPAAARRPSEDHTPLNVEWQF
eukprot:CAMPEP_0114558304 /NCGR_PEP_ID=MMETSP0114-20121206/10303_1 /TAXON_ID=31324 /ORGANISM="Goniomonas sp, Strain m" /LENGTH=337 /DNA_ID=CAMNT_0001743671 /DNA_START=16 /DNA_END=1029 /DNA_ORIENTATION=+